MISIGSPKTISMWFTGKERGAAVGIYLTGPWIGGAIMLSMMNSVVMPLVGYSWRTAFLCFGLLTMAIALLWWTLARDIKPAEAVASASINQVFRSLISVRNVQLIIIMGFLSFAVGHGFNDWLPKILEASGLSPAVAGLSASLPTWISVPSVVLVPRLVAPHLRGRFVALLSLAVSVALLIITTTAGVPLIIGLVLYGLSYCCLLPLLVLILMDLPEVGSRYMGSASGMFFCVAEIGGFLGPFMVGAIKDWGGGFLGGASFLAALSFIRLFIALRVKIEPARTLELHRKR
jgi:cyanate permease